MTMPVKQAIPSAQPPQLSFRPGLHPSNEVRRRDFLLVGTGEAYANRRIFQLVDAHRRSKPEHPQQHLVLDLFGVEHVGGAETRAVKKMPTIVGKRTPQDSDDRAVRVLGPYGWLLGEPTTLSDTSRSGCLRRKAPHRC